MAKNVNFGPISKKNYIFGRGIPSILENSYQKCEEIVTNFLSSFRLVPYNVNGIPPTLWLTMWPECEQKVSLNEDGYCVFTLVKTAKSMGSDLQYFSKWCIMQQITDTLTLRKEKANRNQRKD